VIILGLKEYKEMWKFHLRPWSKIPLFPRDISSRNTLTTIVNGVEKPTPLNRSTVINEQQYLQSLSSVYKKKDCYVSVFSDWQIQNRIFDTIYLEFDAHDENANMMAELMLNKHMLDKKLKKLKIGYRYFFSGRGFHYYLDFEPSYMKDYKSTVLDFLEKKKLIDLVDTSVLECARISRIPYTKHLRTGNFSVYIRDDTKPKDILPISKDNQIIVDVCKNLKPTQILDYLDLDIEPPETNGSDVYSNGYDGWYPECVINIMEKILINKHATHDERKHLAGYLLRFGLNEYEIVEYFKNTTDFNRDYALDQIRSLGHSGYSCRNVRLLFKDLCPGMCEYIREVARRKTP
jgi:hypothetical protein